MTSDYEKKPTYWQPPKVPQWVVINEPITVGCWAVAPRNRPCFVIAVDRSARSAYIQMPTNFKTATVPLDVLNRIEWVKPSSI